MRSLPRIKSAVRKVSSKAAMAVLRMRGVPTVSAYWWDRIQNFGDQLTPELLKSYGLGPFRNSAAEAELLCVGSILQSVPSSYSGVILGAGLMKECDSQFPNASILALRGELTRRCVEASSKVLLGDPGLLAPRLLEVRQSKTCTLGIVPHFKDKNDPRIQAFAERAKASGHIRIIDVCRTAEEVVTDIDACEYIASSSLHGLIVADALGIPNGWLRLSEPHPGNGFKFFDYGTSVSRAIKPLTFSGRESLGQLIASLEVPHARIEEVQHRLDDKFRQFAAGVCGHR